MFGKHILRALAWVFLVSSLALAGCETIDRLDRQSDDLIDKINDPSPPGSGRSSSSSSRSSDPPSASQPPASKGSGLSVVRRDAMPVHTVKDRHGNPVDIWGQSRSTSKTPGHDATIEAKAYAMAISGKYEYITMQRCWRTATSRLGNCKSIPDVIGVRRDGKVDAFEVQSRTDKEKDLEQRLEAGMETLPEERRGDFAVILADPSMKGGLLRDE